MAVPALGVACDSFPPPQRAINCCGLPRSPRDIAFQPSPAGPATTWTSPRRHAELVTKVSFHFPAGRIQMFRSVQSRWGNPLRGVRHPASRVCHREFRREVGRLPGWIHPSLPPRVSPFDPRDISYRTGWLLRDSELIYVASPCVSKISFSVNLVRPGFVDFSYRMPKNNKFVLSLRVSLPSSINRGNGSWLTKWREREIAGRCRCRSTSGTNSAKATGICCSRCSRRRGTSRRRATATGDGNASR